MTKIAKIVKSNSHVDYIGRVIDRLDVDAPPEAEDYGFAQFVSLPVADDFEVIGIIYDTQLVNPEYGQFGPRLSPAADLAILSPDYLNEQGVLVGILLLGWRNGSERRMSVPRRVIPVGQDVYRLDEAQVGEFHRVGGSDGVHAAMGLHYYSQVVAHAGAYAVPLIETIIEQLDGVCTPEERQGFCVLKRSLAWQRTLGGVRL